MLEFTVIYRKSTGIGGYDGVVEVGVINFLHFPVSLSIQSIASIFYDHRPRRRDLAVTQTALDDFGFWGLVQEPIMI